MRRIFYLYLSSQERSKSISGFYGRGVKLHWRPRSRAVLVDEAHSSDCASQRFGGEVAGKRVVYTIEYRFHSTHLLVKD